MHVNVLPFYGVYRIEGAAHEKVALISPWMDHGNVYEYLKKNEDTNRLLLVSFSLDQPVLELLIMWILSRSPT